tara:strand:+ start:1828 stop:2121 length:294 start_codon:yes stop_codon:yes gene_type:complete
MFDGKFSKDDLLEEAYEVYSKILEDAVNSGRTQDPFLLVALFLGLNLAENIIYQKLVDSGCTIESIEKSKEKIEGMAQDIIASVKGKMMAPPSDDKV